MSGYEQLWNQVVEKIENDFDTDFFQEVFSPCRYRNYANGYIYILTPSEYVKSRLNILCVHRINENLATLTKEKVKIKFVLADDSESKQPIKETTTEQKRLNLNANFRFENYVVGPSNMFACRAAMKIAEQPNGLIGNPFYLFGSVGLGKTHLMHAIGNYILDKNVDSKVLYIKAIQFIEDYHKFAKGQLNDFEKIYRDIDVLLIDDIQVLEMGSKTQMEFFKLFDYLHENNKQIVITSDRPAKELNIMQRLTSRFEAGLPADIKVPDSEHRVMILQRKVLESTTKDISKDVLEYIASMFTNNIRELEGALIRLLQYTDIYVLPITLENCKEALQILLSNKKISNSNDHNNITNAMGIVADFYGLTVEDLISKSRQAKFVLARHIAMYIIYKNFGIAYKKIGRLFGDRDHSTVLSAVEKMENEIKNSEELQVVIKSIEKKL